MYIPFNKLTSYRSLFVDYCDAFDNVSAFYKYNPVDRTSFGSRLETLTRQTIESDSYSSSREYKFRFTRNDAHRNMIADVLCEQNRLFSASDFSMSNIELMREPNTAIVISGQQAGLFGGPMYTLIKAIHTIRLAQQLFSEYDGWNFVPVFWIAADDHDYDEVKRFRWIGIDNEGHFCEYNPQSSFANKPVGSIEIDENIEQSFDCFFTTNPQTEFTSELRLVLESAYAAGKTMGDAFGILLSKLLGKYGIVIVNPMDARLKKIGAPLFAHAIEKRMEIVEGIYQRNEQLDKSNYHKQIGLPDDGTNLFIINEGRRESLRTDGVMLTTETGLMLTAADLAKIIVEEPERISPNVVLRPVYQDVLFPVVASVVGPSELAYYAQISGVFELFNLEPSIYIPRLSLTVIEHRISKILDDAGIDWWNCGDVREDLITRVVRSKLPENLYDDIDEFKNKINELTSKFADKILDFEPEIEVTLNKMAQGIANYADAIEKKVRQAYKQKNKMWVDRLLRAANMLFPSNGFQERFFGVIYFVNKFGFEIIDKLVEELNPDEIGHHWFIE